MKIKNLDMNEKKPNEESKDISFDLWQLTASYAIKQYKLALKWASQESSQEWVKKYNQMWNKTYKIYGEQLMPQYTKSWQNIWEEFSIDSFNTFNEYWKKMLIEFSEPSKTHLETREKLTDNWINTWLKK